MSGDPELETPEDDSGRKSYEGEFRGDLKGMKIRFGIPHEWVKKAAPASLVVA